MRKLKEDLLILLKNDDFENHLSELRKYPEQKVINILLSFLYTTDDRLKENTISAIGDITARLEHENPEAVRVIIRRLMLNVTEESGGIGWGSPAAMGEIMARSQLMAEEFHHILISYAEPGGDNFLDDKDLQKDVLSGLKRLASSYPRYTETVIHLLI